MIDVVREAKTFLGVTSPSTIQAYFFLSDHGNNRTFELSYLFFKGIKLTIRSAYLYHVRLLIFSPLKRFGYWPFYR